MAKHTHFTSFTFLIYLWCGSTESLLGLAYLSNTEALRQPSCCTTCCQNLVALLLRMGLSRWDCDSLRWGPGAEREEILATMTRRQRPAPATPACVVILLCCVRTAPGNKGCRVTLSVRNIINTINIQCGAVTSETGWWKQLQVVWLKSGRARSSTHPQAASACSNSANENGALFLA